MFERQIGVEKRVLVEHYVGARLEAGNIGGPKVFYLRLSRATKRKQQAHDRRDRNEAHFARNCHFFAHDSPVRGTMNSSSSQLMT